MLAVELTVPGKDYVKRLLEQGFIINCTHETVLRFLPPFIITTKQVDKFVRQNNRPPGQRQCIRANATLAEHQLPGWAAIRRQGACHLRERH